MHHSAAFEWQQNFASPAKNGKGARPASQSQVEFIKLRNPNLASKGQNKIWTKKLNGEATPVVQPLKRPEPVFTHTRRSRRLQLSNHSIRGLGEINNDFIPPSPSLQRTLAFAPADPMDGPKVLKLADGVEVIMSDTSDSGMENFDCQPFFHAHDYESRLEKDDYESIINKMILGEMNNKHPIYQRELEFQQLQKMVGKSDYVMYYIFGIDKMGFFRLRSERNAFLENVCDTYTHPLRYGESKSSSSSDRTDGEDNDSKLDEELNANHSSHSLV